MNRTTTGITLEAGAPSQALGALLLFVANVAAILATGVVVMGAIYGAHRIRAITPLGPSLHRGRAVGE